MTRTLRAYLMRVLVAATLGSALMASSAAADIAPGTCGPASGSGLTYFTSPTTAEGSGDLGGSPVHVKSTITSAEPVGNHGVEQLTVSHTFTFLDNGATITTSDRAVLIPVDGGVEVRDQSDVV